MRKIWLIGGTKDSADLAQAIADAQISSIVTVTTTSAKNLYPSNFPVRIGCFSIGQMEQFCRQEKITAIVDASHPFAPVSNLLLIKSRNYLMLSIDYYLITDKDFFRNEDREYS